MCQNPSLYFWSLKRKFLVDIDLLIMEPLLLRNNTIPSLTATNGFILNNCFFWGKIMLDKMSGSADVHIRHRIS